MDDRLWALAVAEMELWLIIMNKPVSKGCREIVVWNGR
jgi:hypothetical protein